MALQKQIELENGIVLNYHRITSLNKITNINNIIEISSYTSENQRQKEKEYQLEFQNTNFSLKKQLDVFIETEFISIPYKENMTIAEAYEYIKTLDKYKNAISV